AWRRRARHEAELLAVWRRARPEARRAPAWIGQLVLAADQFVARRRLAEDAEGTTVVAGYHWFGDWGRDTMIALPGLTLVTGRPDVTRRVLATFARFVDRGLLPNRFPEAGEAPEYNTVDATLWYVEAVRAYHAATCYDVIDGPDGNDDTLRPNQIIAVSLPESALPAARQRMVVDACARHLLTSYGLRSLAPSHPEYRGHYGGDQRERAGAYHQGTAWAWLVGPF